MKVDIAMIGFMNTDLESSNHSVSGKCLGGGEVEVGGVGGESELAGLIRVVKYVLALKGNMTFYSQI